MKNKIPRNNRRFNKKSSEFVAEYLNTLLECMGFIDRMRFCFSGNFYKPMKHAAEMLNIQLQEKAVKDAELKNKIIAEAKKQKMQEGGIV